MAKRLIPKGLTNALRRTYIGIRVITGGIDPEELVLEIASHQDTEEHLRSVIQKLQMERQYWYELWSTEGRQYHAAQHKLIEDITNVRRKYGDKNADKLMELEMRAEQQRHELLVDPKKHPSPAVKTELKEVSAPPAAVDA